jgi:hypothetical protein
MTIDKNEIIAGLPILEVRKLLRVSRGGYINQNHVSYILKVTPERGQEIVLALERGGFLEPSKLCAGTWGHTIKGNALANASAARPIKRATAERRLHEFLERVQAVNATSSRYLYRVERVALFGSLLGDGEYVGDVDLAVLLRPTIPDRKKFFPHLQRRGEEGLLAGKTSSDPMDKFTWSETEVWIFLKGSCRALSLCEFSKEWLRWIAPYRIIYKRSGRRKK